MACLQFAIGALNDVRDEPRDAGLKPGKPIPAGLVSKQTAGLVIVLTALAGVALAAPSGPALVALAFVVLGVGVLYDLILKGTPWSWIPFAAGIPILPVYGWLGIAGELPAVFLVVLPVAVAEGGALAIANSLTDVERDRAARVSSAAAALGTRVAALVVAALQAAVGAIALISAIAFGFPPGWVVLVAITAGGLVAAAAAAALPGLASATRRAASWAVQAMAAAALAVTWLAGAVVAGQV